MHATYVGESNKEYGKSSESKNEIVHHYSSQSTKNVASLPSLHHDPKHKEPQMNPTHSKDGVDSLLGLNKKERQKALYQEDSSKRKWGREVEEAAPAESKVEEVEKEKANFGLTGALAKDEATGNMLNGVLLKFSEPLDSGMPDRYWRFYVFRDDEIIETLHVAKKSVFLFGKVSVNINVSYLCIVVMIGLLFRFISRHPSSFTPFLLTCTG